MISAIGRFTRRLFYAVVLLSMVAFAMASVTLDKVPLGWELGGDGVCYERIDTVLITGHRIQTEWAIGSTANCEGEVQPNG